jgi:hypothetical protein
MNNTTQQTTKPSAAADKPAQVWTSAQHTSAVRISERFNVPFRAGDWIDYGDYIGARFEGCLGPIFIGIERDGYAHS